MADSVDNSVPVPENPGTEPEGLNWLMTEVGVPEPLAHEDLGNVVFALQKLSEDAAFNLYRELQNHNPRLPMPHGHMPFSKLYVLQQLLNELERMGWRVVEDAPIGHLEWACEVVGDVGNPIRVTAYDQVSALSTALTLAQ